MSDAPVHMNNFKPPVSTSLSKSRLRDVLIYMKGLRQDNRVLAEAETVRLQAYFASFHEMLLQDARKFGLKDQELEQIEKAGLSKVIFNRMAERTGNTILSEFTILPESHVKTALQEKGFPVFAKTTKYNGLNMTFGFAQIYEYEDPNNIWSQKKSSNSISLLGIDDDIAMVIAKYQPSSLLRALQNVATAANHDMQHHITSETINETISQKSNVHNQAAKYPDKSLASEWQSGGFTHSGDEKIGSYESFMILNHARVWRELAGSEHEDRLKQSCIKFCDQLDRISEKMQADKRMDTAEVIDYMGMLLGNCLHRFLPLDHPIIDMVLSRVKEATPNAEKYIAVEFRALQKEKWDGKIPNATYLRDTIKNYAAAGYDLRQTALLKQPDYLKIKKWQLAAISPEIAYLNSPARLGTELANIQAQTSKLNFQMMQALSVDAATVQPGQPVYLKASYGADAKTCYFNEWGELHREGGPALVAYDKKGNVVEEHWKRNGEYFRSDGPAEIDYYESGQIRFVNYYNEKGEEHRDDGPSNITYHENGSLNIERWNQNGNLHRDDGPAEIRYYAAGQLASEEWHQNGQYFREDDGPQQVRYHDNGKILSEMWFSDRREGRADNKPSYVSYDEEGYLVDKFYRNPDGHDYREDGPSTIRIDRDVGSIYLNYKVDGLYYGAITFDMFGNVKDIYWQGEDALHLDQGLMQKFKDGLEKEKVKIFKEAGLEIEKTKLTATNVKGLKTPVMGR